MDEFWPFHRCNHKSHVRKKKTAVHFITIPCESYKPIDYKESQIFAVFLTALAKFCMLGLKVENVSGVFFYFSVVKPLGRQKFGKMYQSLSFCPSYERLEMRFSNEIVE